jgi:hypothetical protein
VALRPAGANASQLLYPHSGHRGHFAEAPAVAGRRCLGRRGIRGVDVLAVDVLGVADEGGTFLAAGVALLEAVELKAFCGG